MRKKGHAIYDTGLNKLTFFFTACDKCKKKVTNIFLVILFHSRFYLSTVSNSEPFFLGIIIRAIEVGS